MSEIIARLRTPPFGTETSERNLMSAAADTIETLTRRLAEVTAERDKAKVDAQFFAGLIGRLEEDAGDGAVEKAEAERDDLRLAILGGEDAPGSASDVTIARTIKYLDDERSLNQDLRETAKAERDDLRAACVAAREAMKPFAGEADRYDPDEGDDDGGAWDAAFSIGALRRARTALAALEAVLGERDEG